MANLHTAWLLPTRAGIRAGFRAAQRATGGLLAPRAAGTTVARRIGLGLGAKIGVGVGVLCSPRRRWAAASCSAAPVTAGLPALVATAVEDGNGASWIGVAVAAIQRSPPSLHTCHNHCHRHHIHLHHHSATSTTTTTSSSASHRRRRRRRHLLLSPSPTPHVVLQQALPVPGIESGRCPADPLTRRS